MNQTNLKIKKILKKSNIKIQDHAHQLTKTLCERRFYFFIEYIFKNIYKKPFLKYWDQELICTSLEKVYYHEITRLIINIPPRYGKTELVSILFPAWCYIKNINCNFIIASYSDSRALKNSNSIQEIIKHDNFQKFWNIEISDKESAKRRWSIKRGGQTYSVSSAGAVTGEGAGVMGSKEFGGALLIDDPQKADEERSDLKRENVVSNFNNTLATRINSINTPIILITQRIHEGDLSGHLLSGKSISGNFEHIKLSALKENVKPSHYLVSKYDKRKENEPLRPDRHSLEKLLEIKVNNPQVFAGQYQQNPAPIEGSIVKKEWIRYYDTFPESSDNRIFISCDMSFKKTGTSNTCLSVYGITNENQDIYLIDQICEKMSFVETVQNLKRLISRYKSYESILIEDKANGSAIVNFLKYDGVDSVIAVPVPSNQSKEERLSRVTSLYHSGNIFYPKQASWIDEHVYEICTFPKSAYNDRVDSESQFLNYFKESLRVVQFYDI